MGKNLILYILKYNILKINIKFYQIRNLLFLIICLFYCILRMFLLELFNKNYNISLK